MRAATLLLCLCAAAGAAGQPSRQPRHVLDIVAYPLTPEAAAPSETAGLPPGARERDAHRRTRVNLRARLVSLDLSSYETGDPVIYEIELENAGPKPVVIPWSADQVRFTRPAAHEELASHA